MTPVELEKLLKKYPALARALDKADGVEDCVVHKWNALGPIYDQFLDVVKDKAKDQEALDMMKLRRHYADGNTPEAQALPHCKLPSIKGLIWRY